MSETPLLEAREVIKSFVSGSVVTQVLKEVNFSLFPGEMAALLGVSGSGKSTLIQILGTMDRPTSGQVLLHGQEIFSQSGREIARLRNSQIGFVYQFHRLLPEFSALENVAMPLLIGRMEWKKAAIQAEEALTEVGLAHRLTHRPGQLSGGEQQRVAIARAIVTRPALLLADEPTGNLDRETAHQVFTLLNNLNQRMNLTCLMVTHNLELARKSHRTFILEDGRLSTFHHPEVATEEIKP